MSLELFHIFYFDLKFYSCKLKIVRQLKENNHQLRIPFCQQIMTNINEGNKFLEKVWMSDEAHFHLTGYLNKKKYCYWEDSNPDEVYKCPLHASKMTV